MRLYSYIVARDYGFAPNPFYGLCTLATCKSTIRGVAEVGDWIIGSGSAKKGNAGRLVYAMRITEIVSFDNYWNDERFAHKRPEFHGSRKQAYGDNIYHRDEEGLWLQENSHHSYPDGTPNEENLEDDTSRPRVLISDDFTYWGDRGPELPEALRKFPGTMDICHERQGHRSNFSPELVAAFVEWFRSLGEVGCYGISGDW